MTHSRPVSRSNADGSVTPDSGCTAIITGRSRPCQRSGVSTRSRPAHGPRAHGQGARSSRGGCSSRRCRAWTSLGRPAPCAPVRPEPSRSPTSCGRLGDVVVDLDRRAVSGRRDGEGTTGRSRRRARAMCPARQVDAAVPAAGRTRRSRSRRTASRSRRTRAAAAGRPAASRRSGLRYRDGSARTTSGAASCGAGAMSPSGARRS